MFITAVCFMFLIKLRWPKTKSLYETGHQTKWTYTGSRSIPTGAMCQTRLRSVKYKWDKQFKQGSCSQLGGTTEGRVLLEKVSRAVYAKIYRILPFMESRVVLWQVDSPSINQSVSLSVFLCPSVIWLLRHSVSHLDNNTSEYPQQA